MTYVSKTLYIDQGGLFTTFISVRVRVVKKRGRYLYRPAAKPLTSPRSSGPVKPTTRCSVNRAT